MHKGKWGHKYTVYCPLKGCKYTSRVFYLVNDNKYSNHSQRCPIHRYTLQDINFEYTGAHLKLIEQHKKAKRGGK